jgi:predicted GIY-YIG superfamily endonuclease
VTQDWLDRSDILHPGTCLVYRVRDAQGEIIYIGMTTTSLEERFAGHRRDRVRAAAWLQKAVSVEVLPLANEAAAQATEAEEIHRYHPMHNRACPMCGYLSRHALFGSWRRIRWAHGDRMAESWRDYEVFAQDVSELLGPRPKDMGLCLIDPEGLYERGNVRWERPGVAARRARTARSTRNNRSSGGVDL